MKTRPNIRNRYLLIGDLLLIPIAVFASYVLRLELGAAFAFYLPSAYWMAGASIIIKPLVYRYFGLYRRMWMYASIQELKLIIAAVSDRFNSCCCGRSQFILIQFVYRFSTIGVDY